MSRVTEVLYLHGKISENQHAVITEKENTKRTASDKYKTKKGTLTKAQLQELLDMLTD